MLGNSRGIQQSKLEQAKSVCRHNSWHCTITTGELVWLHGWLDIVWAITWIVALPISRSLSWAPAVLLLWLLSAAVTVASTSVLFKFTSSGQYGHSCWTSSLESAGGTKQIQFWSDCRLFWKATTQWPIQSHKRLFHGLSQITVQGFFAVQTTDGTISHDFHHSSLSASGSAVDFNSTFQCSYSGFNQFSFRKTIHDMSEKMSQLTQVMVEKWRYFNLFELCLSVCVFPSLPSFESSTEDMLYRAKRSHTEYAEQKFCFPVAILKMLGLVNKRNLAKGLWRSTRNQILEAKLLSEKPQ